MLSQLQIAFRYSMNVPLKDKRRSALPVQLAPISVIWSCSQAAAIICARAGACEQVKARLLFVGQAGPEQAH